MEDRRKFIESNRDIFDDQEPLMGHSDRFEALLNSKKAQNATHPKKRMKLISVLSIAASIAILIGITFKIYTPQNMNITIPMEDATDIDEFRSTNEFYNQKMEEQIADIMCKLAYTDTQNQKQLSEDIQKIITSNSAFVNEMEKNENQEIAIRYLVRHYKANIARLENINEKIREIYKMLNIDFMKKCILFMAFLVQFFCHSKAHQCMESIPQDSFRIFKQKLDLNMDKVLDQVSDFQIDTNRFSEIGNINVDSIRMLAQLTAEQAIKELERSKAIAKKEAKTYIYSFDAKDNHQRAMRERTRIENKTFSNISEVEFFHKYGNIIVRESNSKRVELEIQYLDKDNTNASSDVSVVGKVLSITTNGGGKNRMNSKINYIISIPKHVRLNINLDYGNIKADQLSELLTANLSYSEMSLRKADNISLRARYSKAKISEVSNADLSGSYSDIEIEKANKITTSGNYNNYRFEEVQLLSIGKSTSYGDCKIGTLGTMEGSIMYTDLDINNLLSDVNITSQYGDIMIHNVSSKAKNINIKGSYCDITIGISPGFSSKFDAVLNYGDLTISKKHTVKYTESTEKSSRMVKKGQIGTGNPTANIVVSNNYADIDIR